VAKFGKDPIYGQGHLLSIEFLTTGSFLHNFSSVYWVFTKLHHIIPMWKGKNPIYFGVIRSKVKVTVTINRVKIQYTELKLSCGNDSVVKYSIYSNSDLDL
jgi:hypothetical protein